MVRLTVITTVRETLRLPSISSHGFIKPGVVRDSTQISRLSVASSSKIGALESHHDTATPAFADPITSFPQSSWNPNTNPLPASQVSGSTTNVPISGTQKSEETEGQSAADKGNHAFVPQSGSKGTSRFQHFPNLWGDGSLGLGAGIEYHHSAVSMIQSANLALPGGSIGSISQPDRYLDSPSTHFGISESVKITISPPNLDLGQIESGEILQIPEFSATTLAHKVSLAWTIPQGLIPTHSKFSDGGMATSISESIGVLGEHLSQDLLETVPSKTSINRLESLPHSVIVFAHHIESIQWGPTVSQESYGIHGYLSSISASRLTLATSASKHTPAPIPIVPATALVQSSITLSSWGRLAHGHELQSTTDGRLTGTPNFPQTTALVDGKIGIFANTLASHTQISSLLGALGSQGIPQAQTGTSSEPTTADLAAPTTKWSMTEPPSQLPTLSTLDGGFPGPSTSINSVHTTASSLNGESIFDALKSSRSIPQRSFGISLGTASGALVIFVCIFLLHKPCYEWIRQRRRRTIPVGHGLGMSADEQIELLPRQAQNPEISHFSADS